MIAETLKENYVWALIFFALNVLFYFPADFIGNYALSGGIFISGFSVLILLVQLVVLGSSFFPALFVAFQLKEKNFNLEKILAVSVAGVIVFSVLLSVFNFSPLLLSSDEDWETQYLDAVFYLSLPDDVSLEQFKAFSYFEAVKDSVGITVSNIGSALLGTALGFYLAGPKNRK